jgi:hypothetical protein
MALFSCAAIKDQGMSLRYTSATAGLILGIIAAFVIVALGLWGVIHWVSSEVQQDATPAHPIDTGRPQGKPDGK